MSEGRLVGKSMHGTGQPQRLQDAPCITCVHKAGARNSLIYLTGLETPDQQRLTEKEKKKDSEENRFVKDAE